MVGRAVFTDMLRELRKTISRFLSLFFISVLGVAIYAGIQYTAPDMRYTADAFYREHRLSDFRLLSNYGFDDDDIESVRDTQGVASAHPSYSFDAYTESDGSTAVVKVFALPDETDDTGPLNTPWLLKGRLPVRTGACLVEPKLINNYGFDIGDTVYLLRDEDEEISDWLKRSEFTIVGIAQDPRYISLERDNSALGGGTVNAYMHIPANDFALEYYTDVYVEMEGGQDLNAFSDAYQDTADIMEERLKRTGEQRGETRYNNIIADAMGALELNRQELNDIEAEQALLLDQARQGILDAEREIQTGREELISAEQALADQYTATTQALDQAKDSFNYNQRELDKQWQSLEQGAIAVSEARDTLNASRTELDAGYASLEELKAQINALESQAAQLPEAYRASLIKQADALKAIYDERMVEWAIGDNAWKNGLADLESKSAAINEGQDAIRNARTQLNDGWRSLDQNQSDFRDGTLQGQQAIEAARARIIEGELALSGAWSDYEAIAAKAAKELDAAWLEIEEAEDDIMDLDEITWYVLDRDDVPGFAGYAQNTDRVDAIGRVFPLLFFMVAALVGLTSMTRMVEEQRSQIGVMKALGYGKVTILGKYVLYALMASLLGSLFGFALGRGLLPEFISRAYGILYDMPPLRSSSNPEFAITALGAAVGSVVGATLLACVREATLTPATLMRPKPPAKGKRILLERIKPLWTRIGFIGKVTARNLFRYKKRFFMTAIGITGCTALLITGFGLRNSIVDMAPKQFIELSKYDIQIGFDSEATSVELADMRSMLNDRSLFSTCIYTQQSTFQASGTNTPQYAATMVVTAAPSRILRFLVMRDRLTRAPVTLDDSGAVINEKLASLLNIRQGDHITLTDDDNNVYNVKVTGIIEHYVGHYVFLTQSTYERVFDEEMEENTVMAIMTNPSTEIEHDLSMTLMAQDAVRGVRFTSTTVGEVDDMVTAMNFVVYILIISAGALAFIVLFNLTDINITERMRELATIKVLGFLDNEVSMYIQRENLLITAIGVAAGCAAGFLLHRFVILTAEVDMVMFSRNIHWESYLYAVLITFSFSLMVSLFMSPRLKRINMVESLKSVE